jgi:hypothetical protein
VPLPYELKQELQRGNLVLFVGAGFVRNYLPTMPLWRQLLTDAFSSLTDDPNEIYKYTETLFDESGNRIIHSAEFLKLAQQFELARQSVNHQRTALGQPPIPSIHSQVQRAIDEAYELTEPETAIRGTHFAASTRLPLFYWVTTNFDTFLEDTYFADAIRAGRASVIFRPVRNVDFGSGSNVPTLLKIHGSVLATHPESSIVITDDDYHQFLRRDAYLVNKLYTLFCERTIVFLGYSLSDPNIQFIYNDVLLGEKSGKFTNQSFSQIRPSFFVSSHTISAEHKAYYRHKRIIYVENYSLERFFQELGTAYDFYLQRQQDVVARIQAAMPEYQQVYEALDLATTAATLNIPEPERRDYLDRILDLIELYEYIGPARFTAPLPIATFDIYKLGRAVLGGMRVVLEWCRESAAAGNIEILEILFDFVQNRLRAQNSRTVRELLDSFVILLIQNAQIPERDRFAVRFCRLMFQYDEAHNDWDDYTYCLEKYVYATQLLAQLPVPVRRNVVRGLYRQLETCGRGYGDSWYTTNKVYDVWPYLNPEAWPLLEAEIRRHPQTSKTEAMLNHLRPGADFRSFHPR